MKAFKYCACLVIVILLAGCASINSKTADYRMSAVADLSTQEELFDAVCETNYEDVRIAAVKRLVDQNALSTIVKTVRVSDNVKCIAMLSITNQNFLADIAISATSPEKQALVAVQGIMQPELLCKCAVETTKENVAVECVEKLTDEELLRKVVLSCKAINRGRENSLAKIKRESTLGDIALRCADGWVHEAIIPRIENSGIASRIIVASQVVNELKLMLVDKISDECFLVEYVKNRQHPETVRRKCLNKISNEDSYVSLLKYSPVLEDWVVSKSIRGVAKGDVLIDAVLNLAFSTDNRLLAFSKLKNGNEFQKVFEMSNDDLPVAQSMDRLDSSYIATQGGQTAILKNFRMVKDDILRNKLLVVMTDATLARLFKKTDQPNIARAMSALPSEMALSASRKALFNSDVILDLALGKYSNEDKVTYWALELNPSENVLVEVALKSQNLSTQCRALARIFDENQIAMVVLSTNKRALKMAAIARLSMNSENALNELAQDSDAAVKKVAMERLKVLGGKKVAEFERKAEEDRRQTAAQEKKLAEEQKARDGHEQREFEQHYLSTAGESQLTIIRKYIELNAQVHIESPEFKITGRVAEFSGRHLVLRVFSGSSEVMVGIEMSRKTSESFVKDEIVMVSGYNDESTSDRLRLRCGELVERGIELK